MSPLQVSNKQNLIELQKPLEPDAVQNASDARREGFEE
jgi:hypothetical protein